MIKKTLNQNAKYAQEFMKTIETDFIFSDKPINRFKVNSTENKGTSINKNKLLNDLKININSIENCNLKNNSKNLVLGEGNINADVMLIGETPGEIEDETGSCFQGEVGNLLNKMLLAIDIKREKIYKQADLKIKNDKKIFDTINELKNNFQIYE